MKINMSAPLLLVDGSPMLDGGVTILLRSIAQNALLGTLKGDENIAGTEKLHLWNLAKRAQEEEAEYTVEEVATIKARIGRAYGPAVVGPAYFAIEP